MSAHDNDIVTTFRDGSPVKRSWLGKVRTTRGGFSGGSGNGLTCPDGTVRLDAEQRGDATALRSYQRWDIALRGDFGTGAPFVLVNGDKAPSKSSAGHQRELFAVLRPWSKDEIVDAIPHGYLPFSAANAARVNLDEIYIVATTPAREIPFTHHDGTEGSTHFLGEMLFRYHGRLYVSGLDRSEPDKRNFYLARLPADAVASTVDEALEALRPASVPAGTLRQGEWFFVPSDVKPKKSDVLTRMGKEEKIGVAIVTDQPGELAKEARSPSWATAQRVRTVRHCASKVYLNGAVHVSGRIRDAEHGTLKLGDGWYKVVRNAADGAWGVTGDVD